MHELIRCAAVLGCSLMACVPVPGTLSQEELYGVWRGEGAETLELRPDGSCRRILADEVSHEGRCSLAMGWLTGDAGPGQSWHHVPRSPAPGVLELVSAGGEVRRYTRVDEAAPVGMAPASTALAPAPASAVAPPAASAPTRGAPPAAAWTVPPPRTPPPAAAPAIVPPAPVAPPAATSRGAVGPGVATTRPVGDLPLSPPRKAARPAPSRAKLPTLILQRRWEEREHAFSILVPKGWEMVGGIFNVDPRTTNGSGNSLAPKCDLTVRRDAAGTVALRLLPEINYADLSSPQFSAGGAFFPVGSSYQGMPVRPRPAATQFLDELFRELRPQARRVQVVEHRPLPELAQTLARNDAPTAARLQQLGLPPNQYDAAQLVVDYCEEEVCFRELLATGLTDMRGSAAMWTNTRTLSLRAPVEEAAAWQALLLTLYRSVEMDPRWVQARDRAVAQRGQAALATQRHVARVAQEIVDHRAATHAEIRHEDYLMLSGQEEYRNPFTGRTEQDTSSWAHRWTSAQGEIIYTDENSFDPNKIEGLDREEWRRSPVRPR